MNLLEMFKNLSEEDKHKFVDEIFKNITEENLLSLKVNDINIFIKKKNKISLQS